MTRPTLLEYRTIRQPHGPLGLRMLTFSWLMACTAFTTFLAVCFGLVLVADAMATHPPFLFAWLIELALVASGVILAQAAIAVRRERDRNWVFAAIVVLAVAILMSLLTIWEAQANPDGFVSFACMIFYVFVGGMLALPCLILVLCLLVAERRTATTTLARRRAST